MTRPGPEAIKDRRHKSKQGGIDVLYFLNTESVSKKFAKSTFVCFLYYVKSKERKF